MQLWSVAFYEIVLKFRAANLKRRRWSEMKSFSNF